MKAFFSALISSAVIAPAAAQHSHHSGHVIVHRSHPPYVRHIPHHHRHWHRGHHWVAPMVIGGAVTYALTRPNTVVIQEPPVVVEKDMLEVVPGTNCTPWREIEQPNGTIVRERTCYSK